MILRRARRAFIAAVLSLCATTMCTTSAAYAQADYPNRQIRVLVGFAAGGPVDVTARIIADALSVELGKPLVVDNRVGAGGNLAADAGREGAARRLHAAAVLQALAISPGIYSKLPFDVLKDFAPVSEVTTSFLVMVVHPSVPAKTLPEFIAYAKARAGKIDYGIGRRRHHHASRGARCSARDAGIADAARALSRQRAGRSPTSSPAACLSCSRRPALAKPFIDSGQLRAIAVTGLRRVDSLPDVPTIDEAGLARFRGERLERPVRAGRHAEADHRSAA